MEAEYIEKQAAVEIAMQYCPDDDGSCSKAGEDIRDLLDELENLKPANVRPVVRGKWIRPTRVQNSMLDECSVCGFPTGSFTFNYCPVCGAWMEGGESDD